MNISKTSWPVQHVRACHNYSIMGKWLLAYRIRNSEFFAWERNSYLTHVISPMGRIEKENYHVDSVCIGCIARHVTLSLGWRHCDVTMTSNLKNEPPHDKTNNVAVRSAKTQISLGIRPVWSESSLCAQWLAKDPSFFHVDSEDFDQTGRMPSWSESSLGAQSFCWFCHEAAQIVTLGTEFSICISRPCKILIVSTLARSFLIESLSNLQVTSSGIRSQRKIHVQAEKRGKTCKWVNVPKSDWAHLQNISKALDYHGKYTG